jgi:ABC-type sugar transport system permease subunit
MGYASVLALFLFAIVMILTTFMFTFLQRGIYYASTDI